MRELVKLRGPFEAAICMWQSFGYYDEPTNAAVVCDIARLLRPGGRFVLDLYNREFCELAHSVREFDRNGVRVIERKEMRGKRQTVTLSYPPPTPPDVFDWQLYTPDELSALGASCGLSTGLSCAVC